MTQFELSSQKIIIQVLLKGRSTRNQKEYVASCEKS